MMVGTNTKTVSRSQAATLIQNSFWDLSIAMAVEYSADDSFIHDHGDQLDRIVSQALDDERLEGIALVVIDDDGKVVDPWEIDVTYRGSRVQLREPDMDAVVSEMRRYGTEGSAVVVLPLVDGVDEFSLPDPGAKIDSYGGSRLEAGLYHDR